MAVVSLEFWYRFDNETLWQRTSAVNAAMAAAYFDHGLTFDSVMESLRVSFAGTNHPVDFQQVVTVGQQGFLDLAAIQLQIMDQELGSDAAIQTGFEEFGQGILHDPRPPRPPGRQTHMMDGTPDTWVGYHRWYAFARAAALLGASARWLHISRCIALAWAIQTEADPPRDVPNNPGLPAARLTVLRQAWMALPETRLDWAFCNHRFRAPDPSLLLPAPALNYARVQALLVAAAGTAQPFHDGQGRFWELPYEQFIALPQIYGNDLIAPPGPNRGANSAIVKILRDQLPGFPRMPLNMPAMAAADIQVIQDWIDAGLPKT